MPNTSPITLLASACPGPVQFSGFLRIFDGNNTSGNSPASLKFQPGNNLGISSSKLNANATQENLAERYGGAGVYGVLYGLTLATSASLNLTVAAGHAMIDGVVEVASAATLVVPASQATCWIWLKADGTLAYSTSTAVPTGGKVCLGFVVTSGTAITAIDYSGVWQVTAGVCERWTADLGLPADTLPSGFRGWTHTLGGTYWWDGLRYLRMVSQSGRVSRAFPSNGNYTATASDLTRRIIEFSTGALSSDVAVLLPLTDGMEFIVFNGTGNVLTFRGATGAGAVVASAKRCSIYCDGVAWNLVSSPV